MLKTFEAAAGLLKAAKKSIAIDNFAFKCHYRVSFGLHLIACILVTSR